MTKTQESQLKMFIVLVYFLELNLDKIKLFPLIVAGMNLVKGFIGKIQDAARLQATIAEGKTDEKLKAQEALIVVTDQVRRALFVIAKNEGNEQLKKTMKGPEGVVRKKREVELLRFAGIVRDEAALRGEALAGAGVTAEVRALLASSYKSYDDAIKDRNESKHGRTGSTGDIDTLTKDAMEVVVETLDNLMKGFEASDPAFHADYLKHRVVTTLGVRHAHNEPEPPVNPQTDTAAGDAPGHA